ncbi:MAG: hypothetical protein U0235_28690 [Polyangiaceae bacterium]
MLRARVHHMFLDAPRSIQHALVRYVTEADRDASLTLGSFIEARADRLARRSRNRKLVTRGKHHDLLAIFAEVNERYFGGTESGAQITWGRRASRPERPRSSIKLGSYDATERLIRIHPVLDRPWVPRYFVAFIVFHELLHHVMPTGRLERTPRAHRGARAPPPGSRRAPTRRRSASASGLSGITSGPWPGRRRTWRAFSGVEVSRGNNARDLAVLPRDRGYLFAAHHRIERAPRVRRLGAARKGDSDRNAAGREADAGAPAAAPPVQHPFAKNAAEVTSMIDDAIEAKRSDIMKCVEAARKRTGDPRGKVTFGSRDRSGRHAHRREDAERRQRGRRLERLRA